MQNIMPALVNALATSVALGILVLLPLWFFDILYFSEATVSILGVLFAAILSIYLKDAQETKLRLRSHYDDIARHVMKIIEVASDTVRGDEQLSDKDLLEYVKPLKYKAMVFASKEIIEALEAADADIITCSSCYAGR